MIVSIAQPAYLPWLGYFHRIAVSDLHISLNHVDIGHRSFANRNKVLTNNGPTWLTVPLLTKGDASTDIDKVRIAADPKWRKKHWSTIEQSYRAAPHLSDHADWLRSLYDEDWQLLEDLTKVMTVGHLERLGIETEIVRSSELEPTETKSALILELCIKVGASVYLSGPFGREYLDLTAFESAGIRVAFHDYAHPEYPQHQGGDFVPYMAAIDALLNCGPDTRSILASGNPGREDYLG